MNHHTKQSYLSEEELGRLIAMTEAEPMLHPPVGFKDDIITQVRQRRARRKNRKLFSYSARVIVATAAALTFVLVMPATVRSEDSTGFWLIQEYEAPEGLQGFTWRLNERMDAYCSKLNGKLNQLVRMEVY